MTLPKSKILSASKSIMAVASLKRDTNKQQQKQVVNINVSPPSSSQSQTQSVHYPAPYEVEEGITVVPTVSERELDESIINPYVENNENAVKALIMIIDIMQSNPLIINKFIVAYADPFKELIKVLTNADDVEVKFVDDIGCFASSKYSLVEDIYVIKASQSDNSDVQTQSLKYAYPDVLRLLDRFNISIKMIANS